MSTRTPTGSSHPDPGRSVDRGGLSGSDRTVTVEFLGLARQRAGRDKVTVAAHQLRDVFAWLHRNHPEFIAVDTATDQHQLAMHWLVCVNEGQFTRDPAERLAEGDIILVLSADVGG